MRQVIRLDLELPEGEDCMEEGSAFLEWIAETYMRTKMAGIDTKVFVDGVRMEIGIANIELIKIKDGQKPS